MKPLDISNRDERDRAKEYITSSLQNPLKFFILLTLAGMNSVEARRLMFNIKNAKNRIANQQVRMQLIKLLRTLIDIVTTDPIVYGRLKSLALTRELPQLKQQVEEEFQGNGGLSSIMNGPSTGTGLDPKDPPHLFCRMFRRNTKKIKRGM